jgi:hypothetical protein
MHNLPAAHRLEWQPNRAADRGYLMRHSRTLPAVLLISLVALAGCSDDSTSAGSGSSPKSGSSPAATSKSTATPHESPAASPSGSPSPSQPSQLPTVRIQAARFHTAALGRSVAGTAEEKAVVDAWMQYWRAATDTYYLGHRVARLDRFADGKAYTDVLAYLRQLTAKQERVVGWARDNITGVKVTGATATVRDCTKNFTFSVDEEGTPITHPMPYYDITGTLEKREGSWVVTVASSRNRKTSCLS